MQPSTVSKPNQNYFLKKQIAVLFLRIVEILSTSLYHRCPEVQAESFYCDMKRLNMRDIRRLQMTEAVI